MKPIVLKLLGANEKSISSAKSELIDIGLSVGEITTKEKSSDLAFDPSFYIGSLYEIIGVISTLGGLAQFVEWSVQKFKSNKTENNTFIIELDGQAYNTGSQLELSMLQNALNKTQK